MRDRILAGFTDRRRRRSRALARLRDHRRRRDQHDRRAVSACCASFRSRRADRVRHGGRGERLADEAPTDDAYTRALASGSTSSSRRQEPAAARLRTSRSPSCRDRRARASLRTCPTIDGACRRIRARRPAQDASADLHRRVHPDQALRVILASNCSRRSPPARRRWKRRVPRGAPLYGSAAASLLHRKERAAASVLKEGVLRRRRRGGGIRNCWSNVRPRLPSVEPICPRPERPARSVWSLHRTRTA